MDAGPEIVFVPLLLIGLGIGALASQLGAVIVSAVPDEESSEVGGLQNTMTNLGASLGTALAGSLLIASLSSAFITNIQQSPAITRGRVQAQVELAGGVPFISDADLEAALEEATSIRGRTDARSPRTPTPASTAPLGALDPRPAGGRRPVPDQSIPLRPPAAAAKECTSWRGCAAGISSPLTGVQSAPMPGSVEPVSQRRVKELRALMATTWWQAVIVLVPIAAGAGIALVSGAIRSLPSCSRLGSSRLAASIGTYVLADIRAKSAFVLAGRSPAAGTKTRTSGRRTTPLLRDGDRRKSMDHVPAR